ncbi:MAG: helix-turn-helix transcriptional regulator [Anaerovoracaceae bacterium]
MKEINRLKAVLTEQKKTGKWLSENLGKDVATVSRWCNNHAQPSIETFTRIAELLNVDVSELLNKTK